MHSRQRAILSDGREVALGLERGTILRDGDLLQASDGSLIAVAAADEPVSVLYAIDAQTLARVAYHLGNRHVPLQVGDGFIRFERDHVLDEMIRGLGLEIVHEQAPFEPEPGAYSVQGQVHGHVPVSSAPTHRHA